MSAPLDQVTVSDTNLTPIVQIVTWFCLATSLLAFITHAGIKLYISRALKVETWLVLLALVFCVAQSIAVLLQARYGFGRPLDTLSDSDIQSNLKSEYAATMSFFMSLGFSRLAIVAFVHNITPFKLHSNINLGIGMVTVLWMISSVLVVAFQCPLPHPWNRMHGQCIDRFSWWNAVSALNIATEAAIVILELCIIAHIRIARQRKVSVMSIFACRSLVILVIVVQLVIFHQENKNSVLKDDLTLGFWRSTVCNQIVQCLGIVTTCLPYTKVFMESFDSGLMRLDDLRRRGEHTRSSRTKSSRTRSSRTRSSSKRDYQLMDVSRSTRDKTINVSRSWDVQVEPLTRTSPIPRLNHTMQ